MNYNPIIELVKFTFFAIVSTLCIFIPLKNLLNQSTNTAKEISVSLHAVNRGIASLKIDEISENVKNITSSVIPETEEDRQKFKEDISGTVSALRAILEKAENKGVFKLITG